MKNTISKKTHVGNALAWASMMIASALVVKDETASSTMLMLLLMGWFASSMNLGSLKEAARAECAYFKRLIGR